MSGSTSAIQQAIASLQSLDGQVIDGSQISQELSALNYTLTASVMPALGQINDAVTAIGSRMNALEQEVAQGSGGGMQLSSVVTQLFAVSSQLSDAVASLTTQVAALSAAGQTPPTGSQ